MFLYRHSFSLGSTFRSNIFMYFIVHLRLSSELDSSFNQYLRATCQEQWAIYSALIYFFAINLLISNVFYQMLDVKVHHFLNGDVLLLGRDKLVSGGGSQLVRVRRWDGFGAVCLISADRNIEGVWAVAVRVRDRTVLTNRTGALHVISLKNLLQPFGAV